MIEIPIQTTVHDFKPHISNNGMVVLIVNQYSTNTCQIINTQTKKSIWSIDIDSKQVMAFPSYDYHYVFVFYIIDLSLIYEIYDIDYGLIFNMKYDNIKGLHCINGEFISLMDINNVNWIMEVDRSGNPINYHHTLGPAYDIIKIDETLIYLEVIGDIYNIVCLINNKVIYQEQLGTNVLAYMTSVKNYLTVTITPKIHPKKIKIKIFKYKNQILNHKYERTLDSTFTSYSYLNKPFNKLFVPTQNYNKTYLKVITLNKNIILKKYEESSIEDQYIIDGSNWIFNHTDDFSRTVGLSSSLKIISIL